MKQWLLAVVLCSLLISCGQSGKLYLPKPNSAPNTVNPHDKTTAP